MNSLIDQLPESVVTTLESSADLPLAAGTYSSRLVTRLENVKFPSSFTNIPLSVALAEIKLDQHKSVIDNLRGLYARSVDNSLSDDERKAARHAYKEGKLKLPACAFNGTFQGNVSNNGFNTSSELAIIDMDNLSARGWSVPVVKQKLSTDLAIVAVFESPSGDGVKVLIAINPVHNDSEFKKRFTNLEFYFLNKHGLIIDPSGKDIRRVCFMSSDPDIYINYNADVVDLNEYAVATVNKAVITRNTVKFPITAELIAKIQSALPSLPECFYNDYDKWRDIVFAVHWAFNGSDEGFQVIDEWSNTAVLESYGTVSKMRQITA